MSMAETAASALAGLREEMIQAVSDLVPALGPREAYTAGVLHACALKALAAADAALGRHQRLPLYGNAATEEEPGSCPHHPDSDLHFESGDEGGEWLCEGKPEGAVCSTCIDGEGGGRVEWPCSEYAAILAPLTGEGKADG